MAEDLISEYIDRQGIRQDTDFMLSALNELLEGVNKLKGAKITFEGAQSFRDAANAAKEYSGAMVQVDSANKQLANGELQAARAAKENELAKKAAAGAAKESANAAKAEAQATKELANTKKIEAQTEKELALTKKAQVQTENEVIKQIELERKYTAELTKEKEKLQKSIEGELKQQAKLNNEYEQLKAKYTIAANTAKQLAAAKGLDNEETKEAVAMAQQYFQQLSNIEKAVGQSQRNVGNYTQATFALNQVLREAPAFANSFQTGIMAISNNLPILRDEFVKLREATGSNMSALGALAKSLFSWNTILLVGITLVTVFAKEIKEWGAALFSNKKSMDDNL